MRRYLLFKGVPPGEYRAFAWDDVQFGVYEDPEILKRSSVTASN